MKHISIKHLLIMLLSAVLLSGCETLSSSDEDTDTGATTSSETTGDAGGAETRSAPATPEMTAEQMRAEEERKKLEAKMKEQAALREIRTFYFDFDKASLKAETKAPLMAHAEFLANNPATKIVIEGHCDERGTKEYNIALGESRAKALSRFLIVNGVSASQIEVISYGEERPADAGHTESAWAKNRRAYIEYK